jgi:hypothetical protein
MDKDKQESLELNGLHKVQKSHDSANVLLAWYSYPEPDGKIYTSKELESLTVVEELFDYCQILLAFISQEGWQFLVETHGVEKLLAVNTISGWFSEDSPQDAFDDLRYRCLTSGYDPATGFRGYYDGKAGIFLPEQGGEYQILWGDWDA